MKWKLSLFGLAIAYFMSACGTIYAASITNPNCSQTPVNGAYGRNWECSYFANSPVTYSGNGANEVCTNYCESWVLEAMGRTNYTGITQNWQSGVTLASFIAGIQARLFDPTSSVNNGRAAAVVDVMLGQKGTAFGNSSANGIAYAQNNFSTWENLVNAYASGQYPGYKAQFHQFITNWNQFPSDDGMGLVQNDPQEATTCGGSITCYPDIVFENNGVDPTPDFADVFYYPGGQFIIKEKCGNLTGDLNALPNPVPQASVSCAGLNVVPAAPDPNQNITLRVSVKYNPATYASTAFGPDSIQLNVSGPSPYRGYTSSQSTLNTSGGTVTATFTVPATVVSGSFTANWQVTGLVSPLGPSPSCSAPVTVSYQPYFTISGGDVSAGQGFGNSCQDNTSADIKGYNMDTGGGSPNYFGASTTHAALATGNITGFATDTTNDYANNLGGSTDGIAADPPSALAGANANPTPPTYGGSFLGSYTGNWCVPDYAAGVTTTTGTALPNFSTLAPSSTPYVYRVPSGAQLGGFQLPAGVHVIVMVSGDAYVTGNITYAPYNVLTDVPSFTLMTTGGSTYIDESVTELHGFFDAQPDGTGKGGVLFSCAAAIGVPVQNYASCNQPLTIYGAVAAKQVIFGRTKGTVDKASGIADTPAEQIIYTPELWLGALSAPMTGCAQDPTQSQCLYESYTTLPPVL